MKHKVLFTLPRSYDKGDESPTVPRYIKNCSVKENVNNALLDQLLEKRTVKKEENTVDTKA